MTEIALMMDSDIENGRVLVNWWITALVVFASVALFGTVVVDAGLLSSAAIGLLCVAVWVANELRTWTPGEDVDVE